MPIMDPFSRDDLKRLIQEQGAYRLSLYMPAHRSAAKMQEDRIRYKNVLARAEELMEGAPISKKERTSLKKRMSEAAFPLNDDAFWRYQSDGLAAFVSEESASVYRLPQSFPELVVGSHRFHIAPLLPLFGENAIFYILALSHDGVKLWRCNRFAMEEVELPNIPGGMAETLGYDEPGTSLQWYTGTPPVPSSGRPGRPALFHGTAGAEQDKEEIRAYFRVVEKEVRRVLPGEKAPMVLAGVEYLLPLYREVSGSENLLKKGIEGAPDDRAGDQLREKAWEIVHPDLMKPLDDAIAQYMDRAGTGLAASAVEEIVPEASSGRVGTLVIARNEHCWGEFDRENHRVTIHDGQRNGNLDLLDLAAAETISNSGEVFTVEREKMPDKAPLIALYRY